MDTVKRKKRRTYSQAEKSRLLAAYRSSGLSSKQWCIENSIGLSTLHRWARDEQKHEISQKQQTWVPVVMVNEEKVETEVLSIQAGPFNIEVAANTDIKLLASVLAVIRKLC